MTVCFETGTCFQTQPFSAQQQRWGAHCTTSSVIVFNVFPSPPLYCLHYLMPICYCRSASFFYFISLHGHGRCAYWVTSVAPPPLPIPYFGFSCFEFPVWCTPAVLRGIDPPCQQGYTCSKAAIKYTADPCHARLTVWLPVSLHPLTRSRLLIRIKRPISHSRLAYEATTTPAPAALKTPSRGTLGTLQP